MQIAGSIRYSNKTTTAVITKRMISPPTPKPSPVALAASEIWQKKSIKTKKTALILVWFVPARMLTA
jgi:hypothetical protein